VLEGRVTMNNNDKAKHNAGEKSIAKGVNELRLSQKRPPKRKKGRFSRSPKGGNNQKQSTYDFNAARMQLALPMLTHSKSSPVLLSSLSQIPLPQRVLSRVNTKEY
jgi:hypothetical protein